MVEQGEHLVISGVKLAFGRVKHSGSAWRLWRLASRSGNRRALRLLVRIAIDYIHDGLVGRRLLVLEILRDGSVLGLMYERLCKLFESIVFPDRAVRSMTRLAEAGDNVASLVLATMMDHARRDANYGFIVRSYRFLTRAMESGCVPAAPYLACQLRLDGHFDVALALLLWAVNRGNFAAACELSMVGQVHGSFLCGSLADQDALCGLAIRLALCFGDPWAAFWLASRLIMPGFLDFVAAARLFRRARIGAVACEELPGFWGEVLWDCDGRRGASFAPSTSDVGRMAGVFALMSEETRPRSPCFKFFLAAEFKRPDDRT